MKLKIKKKFFDKIKSKEKEWEFRDAHITFVCEETGEELKKKVTYCTVNKKEDIIRQFPETEEVLEDEDTIAFLLEKEDEDGNRNHTY